MKSMVECAKYANTGVTFVCDGDDHVYTAEEMSERWTVTRRQYSASIRLRGK